MTTPPSYYGEVWDVDAWVDVISVEYESLVEAYPFDQLLASLTSGGGVRLLDVGCGTAIFPTYLDPVLRPSTSIRADLLDLSGSSLAAATQTLAGLEHFEVGERIQERIEDIPSAIGPHRSYDVIWAIHSFTTVDVSRMSDVYERLLGVLAPEGLLLVYQLTADSSYQVVHDFYLSKHPRAASRPRYMEFEDSRRILDDFGISPGVSELHFDHVVPADEPTSLSKYLAKVVLNDEVDSSFFAPILDRYAHREFFVFPQSVNLIEVRK